MELSKVIKLSEDYKSQLWYQIVSAQVAPSIPKPLKPSSSEACVRLCLNTQAGEGHKTRTLFTELGLDNERRCRGKRKNSSSDSSKLHSLMEFYRFQLQVTINPTQTGLTKSINLLAHTKKTPGGGLTSGLVGSRCSNCLSLPLSSAFFCVGSILRQIFPSWQK